MAVSDEYEDYVGGVRGFCFGKCAFRLYLFCASDVIMHVIIPSLVFYYLLFNAVSKLTLGLFNFAQARTEAVRANRCVPKSIRNLEIAACATKSRLAIYLGNRLQVCISYAQLSNVMHAVSLIVSRLAP